MFQRHMAQESTRERRATLLLEKLREATGKPLGLGELMQRARIHPGERTEVKRTLRDLTRDGVVHRDGKRYSIPGARPAPNATATQVARPSGRPVASTAAPARGSLTRRGGIVGTLTKHRDGYGFVARLDRGGDDVFVPPDEAGKALDGDLVRIEIVPGTAGRTMGRLVEVVQRRRRWLLGTYHARGASSFVVPADAELEGYVGVPETDLAEEGEVVKVELEPGVKRLSGHVVERVGKPGEPRVEVLRVAYAKGFSDLFPADVREEAEGVPDHVRDEDRAGRRDLTSLRLVTIDGEDARDFDDAVYCEPAKVGRAKGWRLLVAIADVSHYVETGNAIDIDAYDRATSVYFPRRVIPMLPEKLSNGLCSLNPEVDRLCMVCDMLITAAGDIHAYQFYPAVMYSHARMTYTEVAAILANTRGPEAARRKDLVPHFLDLSDVYRALLKARNQRGAVDFDTVETQIICDENGRIEQIVPRVRNDAHKLIEEAMLAANVCSADFIQQAQHPGLFRVHEGPTP
ncbi:MAG: ribonuclease R family protein, partial [Anaeromyxobacteraceae bacterium]